MDALLPLAVIVVGALGLTNLLLTAGVIRRLRVHSDLIQGGLDIGSQVAPAQLGRIVVPERLEGASYDGWWAIFDADCGACKSAIEALRTTTQTTRQWNTVVVGQNGRAENMIQQLTELPSARSHEMTIEEVSRVFGVTRFPTFMYVDGNRIEWASVDLPPDS